MPPTRRVGRVAVAFSLRHPLAPANDVGVVCANPRRCQFTPHQSHGLVAYLKPRWPSRQGNIGRALPPRISAIGPVGNLRGDVVFVVRRDVVLRARPLVLDALNVAGAEHIDVDRRGHDRAGHQQDCQC